MAFQAVKGFNLPLSMSLIDKTVTILISHTQVLLGRLHRCKTRAAVDAIVINNASCDGMMQIMCVSLVRDELGIRVKNGIAGYAF